MTLDRAVRVRGSNSRETFEVTWPRHRLAVAGGPRVVGLRRAGSAGSREEEGLVRRHPRLPTVDGQRRFQSVIKVVRGS